MSNARADAVAKIIANSSGKTANQLNQEQINNGQTKNLVNAIANTPVLNSTNTNVTKTSTNSSGKTGYTAKELGSNATSRFASALNDAGNKVASWARNAFSADKLIYAMDKLQYGKETADKLHSEENLNSKIDISGTAFGQKLKQSNPKLYDAIQNTTYKELNQGFFTNAVKGTGIYNKYKGYVGSEEKYNQDVAETERLASNAKTTAGKIVAKGTGMLADNMAYMAPSIALSVMTSGGSAVTSLQQVGATVLQNNPSIVSALSKGASNLASNPQFWMTAAQTTGTSYYDALNDGATENQAQVYGLVNGLVNSAIENGLGLEDAGIQDLMQNAKTQGVTLKQYLMSMNDEGLEEVKQGIFERGLQNVIYGKDNKIASVSDENAVFNPITSAKEYGAGALMSGILGAPSSVISNVRAKNNTQAQTQTDTPVLDSVKQQQQQAQQTTDAPILDSVEQQNAQASEEYANTRLGQLVNAMSDNQQGQQSFTSRQIDTIIYDKEALTELGIDPNGKTKSQLRAEVRNALNVNNQQESAETETAEETVETPKTDVEETVADNTTVNQSATEEKPVEQQTVKKETTAPKYESKDPLAKEVAKSQQKSKGKTDTQKKVENIAENQTVSGEAYAVDKNTPNSRVKKAKNDINQSTKTMEQKLDDAEFMGQQKQAEYDAKEYSKLEKKMGKELDKKQKELNKSEEKVQKTEAKVVKSKEKLANVMADIKRQKELSKDRSIKSQLLATARKAKGMKHSSTLQPIVDMFTKDLYTGGKSMTEKKALKLEMLETAYEETKAMQGKDFVPNEILEEKIRQLSQKEINEMTTEDAKNLTKVLKALMTQQRNTVRFINSSIKQTKQEAAIDNVKAIEASGEFGDFKARYQTSALNGMRLANELVGGDKTAPFYQSMQDVNEGNHTRLNYEMSQDEKFGKFFKDKAFMSSLSGKNNRTIDANATTQTGEKTTVKLTPDMVIFLHLNNLCGKNSRAINNRGVTIMDESNYDKGNIAEAVARASKNPVKIESSEINRLYDNLTDKQKEYADMIHDYFQEAYDEINGVYEAEHGFALDKIKDYFPIIVDKDYTSSQFDAVENTIKNIENSFLKERSKEILPVILVEDATDALTKYIELHAGYIGTHSAIKNLIDMVGGQAVVDGEADSSFMKAVGNKYGTAGQKAIRKLVYDLQGRNQNSDQFLSKIRSNYAQAALTLNAQTAAVQSASYANAAPVLGFKPLMRALADKRKVTEAEINKWTPLYWFRSRGYGSTEQGIIAEKDGFLNRHKALNWIQAVDLATTRKLWVACEYYVKEHNPSLDIKSDEFKMEQAKIYNRVIEETQPNYTTLQKPQILRSDSEVVRNLQMFKTQLYQDYGIISEAITDFKYQQKNGTPRGKANARKTLTNAFVSQVVSAGIVSAVKSAIGILRGRDDWEEEDGTVTFKSAAKGFAWNLASNMSGIFIGGSEIMSAAESISRKSSYYGFEGVSENALSTALDAIVTFGKKVNSESSEIGYDDLYSMVKDIAPLAGVPVNNVMNIFKTAYRNSAKIIYDNDYLAEYEYLKTFNGSNSDMYQNAYLAYKNGSAKDYYQVSSQMVADGIEKDNLESAIKQRIKKEYVDDEYINNFIVNVRNDFYFKTATSEEKEAILEYAEDYATYQSIKDDMIKFDSDYDKETYDKIQQAISQGVSFTMYYRYKEYDQAELYAEYANANSDAKKAKIKAIWDLRGYTSNGKPREIESYKPKT